MSDLVIVEHADTGETTLHRATCGHIKRAGYKHPAPPGNTPPTTDRVCHTCKPTIPHTETPRG